MTKNAKSKGTKREAAARAQSIVADQSDVKHKQQIVDSIKEAEDGATQAGESRDDNSVLYNCQRAAQAVIL